MSAAWPRRALARTALVAMALAAVAPGCLNWSFAVCDADRQRDRNNCGRCGVACPAAQVCDAGQCVCPNAGEALCGAACLDTRADRDNCGACGHACDSAAPVCSAGQCVGVTQLSAGLDATCALLADQTVRCWGGNRYGQLGAGSASDVDPVPRTVTLASGEPLGGATQVSMGATFACAVAAGGAVFCWGKNEEGECGAGADAAARLDHATPVVGADGTALAGIARVSAGGAHACAVSDAGSLWCWGDNTVQQFGLATPARSPAAVRVSPAGVRDVGAGAAYTCALATAAGTESLYCFGANVRGELGRGPPVSSTGLGPAPVSWPSDGQPHAPVAFMSAGYNHVCAGVGPAGSLAALYCWGDNAVGETNPTTGMTPVLSPMALTVGAQRASIRGVTAGGAHTCAWADGSAVCMGLATNGQLGGTPSSSGPPVVPLVAFRAMAAGGLHTCAIAAGSGLVTCWGSNEFAQLGDRDAPPTMIASRAMPQPVHW